MLKLNNAEVAQLDECDLWEHSSERSEVEEHEPNAENLQSVVNKVEY